jgi:hypothetical protein
MADAVYAADVLYPEYSGDEDIDGLKKYVQSVSDYLFLLREGLGYTLDNLGINNFSPTSIQAIGDVIREPVMVQLTDQNGKLLEFEATLEGINTTVSEITEEGYVSLTKGTQTAGLFSFTISDTNDNALIVMNKNGMKVNTIVDGQETAAVEMGAAGLTVYRGNIVIKNDDGTEVFYADDYGNLLLTGTIYGSEIYTCDIDDITTAPHFAIGTYNNAPTIQSFSGDRANGFRAVGSASNPYYGLLVATEGVDFRTWYNNAAQSVQMGMNNSKAVFGINGSSATVAYNDPANNISNYVEVTQFGVELHGIVTVNGTPI